MALETQGFNIQVPTPDLAQGYQLSGLKPLSFAGGQSSPIKISPLAGWSVPSARPEIVSEGIGSGISQAAQGISQGIQAIYLNKQKQAEKDQEIQLKREERASQEKIAGIKSAESNELANLRLEETRRHNQEMENFKQHMIDAGAKGFTNLQLPSFGEYKDSTPPTPASTISDKYNREEIKTDADFGKLPTDKEIEEMGGTDFGTGSEPPKDVLPAPKNPLGDITSPVPTTEAPTIFNNQQALKQLSNVDWANQNGFGAGLGAGASVSATPTQPSLLRNPKQYFNSLSNLGGMNNQESATLERVLGIMDGNQALASQKAPVIPEYEKELHKNYKGIPDQTAQAILEYSKARGMKDIELPVLTGVGNGMTEVKWPTAADVKKASMFGDLGEQRLKQRQEFKEIDSFNQSVDKFNQDTAVKQAKDKIKPTMEKFFGDLTTLVEMGENYGNRSQLDQSLMDQYVRFATGNVPTHNQYEMLTNNRPLWNKLQTLAFKNVPASSTNLLTPEERKEMAESMTKVLNMEHEGLNTLVASKNRMIDRLESQNITEDNRAHKYPILRLQGDVEKEISQTEKEMNDAWGNRKNKQPKDVEAYKKATQRHMQLLKDLDIAKTGIPANFDDLKQYGEVINGVRYPAGWSGRLIYHETPQQPIFIAPDGGTN